MASLPDLFVSYKSVTPKKTTKTSQASAAVNMSGRLERAKREAARSSERKAKEAEESEEENGENTEDNSSTRHNFTSYTAQSSNGSDNTGSADVDWLTSTYNSEFSYNPASVGAGSKGISQKDIEDLFARNGISIKVTSGKREAGQAGTLGDKSHHVTGDAWDIVPTNGLSFADLRNAMVSNPEINQFFAANGLGVLDETDPAVKKKTHATGDHFHIGPDQSALDNWAAWTNSTGMSKHGGKFATIRDLYEQSFNQYR